MKATPNADAQIFDLAKELYFARVTKLIQTGQYAKEKHSLPSIASESIADAVVFMGKAVQYFAGKLKDEPAKATT